MERKRVGLMGGYLAMRMAANWVLSLAEMMALKMDDLTHLGFHLAGM